MLSSSSGLGCHPLTVEIAGSNPAGSTRKRNITFMFLITACQKEDQHLRVHRLDKIDRRGHVRKDRDRDRDDQGRQDRFQTVLSELQELVLLVHQWVLVRKDRVRSERRTEIKGKCLPMR